MLRVVDRAAYGAHDRAAGNHRRVLERQSGGAEGAFGHRAADIPVGAAATGAIIRLMLAIDDMIAALVRLRDDAAAARLEDTRRHNSWLLSQHLSPKRATSLKSF